MRLRRLRFGKPALLIENLDYANCCNFREGLFTYLSGYRRKTIKNQQISRGTWIAHREARAHPARITFPSSCRSLSVSSSNRRTEVDEYKCPKCRRKALSVRFRETRARKLHRRWIREYRCPRGHKWKRPMLPPLLRCSRPSPR